MSARHRALLDAILRAPADDELRLVYADLLEEEGEPVRAELIRAQIAAGGEDAAARARADQLEARYGAQLAGVVASYARRWTFSRGLVSTISSDLETLGAHLETLLAAAPIHTLQLSDDERDEVGEDAATGQDAASDGDRDARRLRAARAIAACPRLAAIETIDATFCCLEDAPLEALLASASLTGLGRLVLGRDELEQLPRLRRLRFGGPWRTLR